MGIYKNFTKPQKILYYANIVPHVFINPDKKYEFNSYSYSINSNAKDATVEDSIIQFFYEYSPITIEVKKKGTETVGRFIVNILSMIGGVFIIFGLLNRAITWIVTSVVSKPS